jgi:hypothetical protein
MLLTLRFRCRNASSYIFDAPAATIEENIIIKKKKREKKESNKQQHKRERKGRKQHGR